MSLWNVPLESLTFDQLDDFLSMRLPEGSRLDYKLEVPKDLAKIIAGFANTLGGMIVLGVDEDKKTTEPIWPPLGNGMKSERGLHERVTQIARDNIYPPVSIRLSQVIENKHLPGHELLVIRVDESKDAPHAVERRREVYVYEREERVSTPYHLADIDHITRLLDRRRRIEDDRDRMLQTEIDRATRFLHAGHPLRWASVVPLYPWRELYPPSLCYRSHPIAMTYRRVSTTAHQQMPDGSYLRGLLHDADGCGRYICCSRLHSKGLVFLMERTERLDPENGVFWVDLVETARLLKNVISGAAKMYQGGGGELPGHLMVSMGLLNAANVKLYALNIPGDPKSRHAFIEGSYREDRFTDAATLLERPHEVGSALLEGLVYSFDVPPIPDHHKFFERCWTNL